MAWSGKQRKRPRTKEKPAQEPTKTDISFLGLPPELRYSINEYTMNTKAVLRPQAPGRLLGQSPLLRVSRQLREEAASVMYLMTPRITAHVKNLNFFHIVTFFNRLSERESNALPSLTALSDRKIQVKIHITDACRSNPNLLHRWLRRSGTNCHPYHSEFGSVYLAEDDLE
ncbi:hypothetical protein LTR53_015717 [Teratosphaeriaceae sp. CCFEE 6253]|nr:hypothetical protein LTR53_015717 [Teratosphaeriaceae sp. CCFEE 6253]